MYCSKGRALWEKAFLPLDWEGILVPGASSRPALACVWVSINLGGHWQDGNPELPLPLTILALGSQADLVHGHLPFERMFYPTRLSCKGFHLQRRYIKQMTSSNRLPSALGL